MTSESEARLIASVYRSALGTIWAMSTGDYEAEDKIILKRIGIYIQSLASGDLLLQEKIVNQGYQERQQESCTET